MEPRNRFLLVLLAALAVAPFSHGQSTFGDATYVQVQATGILDARTQAAAMNGHLACIGGAAENDFVRQNFGGSLIGFSDESEESSFIWDSGEAVVYTNWALGEPNNSGNEDYVVLQGDGTWNDIPAGSTLAVIEIPTATLSHEADYFTDFENGTGGWHTASPLWEHASPSTCLLYTSPSPRDKRQSRMPSSA